MTVALWELFEEEDDLFGETLSLPGNTQSSFAFPSVPQEFHFQIFVGGSWVEITHDARYAPTVDITRGRADWSQRVGPGKVGFTLEDLDGRYGPRNPAGLFYGLIGRNTPVRISNRGYYRFHGEIVAWPSSSNKPGTDVWVDVEAAGIMQRLGAGARPLRSPLTRWYQVQDLLAWWPLEGDLSSGLPDGRPMVVAASLFNSTAAQPLPVFESANVVGTARLVEVTKGIRLDGVIPTHVPATGYTVETVVLFQPDPTDNFPTEVLRLLFVGSTTLARVNVTGDTNGHPSVLIENTSGGSATATDSARNVYDNKQRHWRVEAYQNGADVTADLYIDGVLSVTVTLVTETLGVLRRAVGNFTQVSTAVPAQYMGQFAVATGVTIPSGASAASGYNGESAANRMGRLCAENGIPFTLVGNPMDTPPMGPQRVDKLLNLLHDAGDSDAGILHESRDTPGLAHRTRTSMYNQTPALRLDYGAAHLFGPLAPADDDQRVYNDVEAKRVNGGSARYTIDVGPLSTQDPPAGVGTYDESRTYNVQSDDQLRDIASERAHIGTWDEARYPQITIALHSPEFADPDLLAAAIAVDVGDLIVIDNPPAWLPPDEIELLVQGVAERFDPHTWTITFNCVPYGPYRVFRIEGGVEFPTGIPSILGNLAPAGQTLNGQHAADAVELSVVTAPGFPLLSLNIDDYPVDIMLAGERITVGFVIGSSSPQLLQVLRAVNGVSKVLPAGLPITVYPGVGLAR